MSSAPAVTAARLSRVIVIPLHCLCGRPRPGPDAKVYAVHLILKLGVRRTLVKVEQETTAAPRRPRLNKDRVLRAAVVLADEAGIEALSMRKLAEHLGVVPMALYK